MAASWHPRTERSVDLYDNTPPSVCALFPKPYLSPYRLKLQVLHVISQPYATGVKQIFIFYYVWLLSREAVRSRAGQRLMAEIQCIGCNWLPLGCRLLPWHLSNSMAWLLPYPYPCRSILSSRFFVSLSLIQSHSHPRVRAFGLIFTSFGGQFIRISPSLTYLPVSLYRIRLGEEWNEIISFTLKYSYSLSLVHSLQG